MAIKYFSMLAGGLMYMVKNGRNSKSLVFEAYFPSFQAMS
jgi:hypothetical protein